MAVTTTEEVVARTEDSIDAVAIEELQFFEADIVAAFNELAGKGYEAIVTGLDMDIRGKHFGPVPALLAVADEVVKLRAICARCGRDASRSQRLICDEPAPVSALTILVGAWETYEARCRHCHEV